MSSVQSIAVISVVNSPFQPRLEEDEAFLDELTASIREKGVLTPLLVRPARTSGLYEIVDGNTTLKAAKRAGFTQVPCIVKALSDQAAMEITWHRNNLRKDWRDYEKAQFLHEYGRRFNLTQEEIGQRMGKDQPWVAHHIAMIKAVAEKYVPGHIVKQLSEHQFRALTALPPETQAEVVKTIEETGDAPSVREIERLGKGEVTQPPEPPTPEPTPEPSPPTEVTPRKETDIGTFQCSMCQQAGERLRHFLIVHVSAEGERPRHVIKPMKGEAEPA